MPSHSLQVSKQNNCMFLKQFQEAAACGVLTQPYYLTGLDQTVCLPSVVYNGWETAFKVS